MSLEGMQIVGKDKQLDFERFEEAQFGQSEDAFKTKTNAFTPRFWNIVTKVQSTRRAKNSSVSPEINESVLADKASIVKNHKDVSQLESRAKNEEKHTGVLK